MPTIQQYLPHILLFFLVRPHLDLYQQKEEVSFLAGLLLHFAHFGFVYLFNHGIHLLDLFIIFHYTLFSMNFKFDFDFNLKAGITPIRFYQLIELFYQMSFINADMKIYLHFGYLIIVRINFHF